MGIEKTASRWILLPGFLALFCCFATPGLLAGRDLPEYDAVAGGRAALPCNVTAPTADDSVALIIWFRGDSGSPIYSVDARTETLESAQHFASDKLETRVFFNITGLLGTLLLDSVEEDDSGEYRCRLDFKKARTEFQAMKLNVIVPPMEVVIVDEFGQKMAQIIGPYNEGSTLNLTCYSKGGNPLPAVTWWRSSSLIDDTYYPASQGRTRNDLVIPQLERKDFMSILKCQASNSDLVPPVSVSVTLDMNLKPTDVRIITQWRPLTANEIIEVVCQTTGSRPPAMIIWYKGEERLTDADETASDDSSVTTSFLTYVPLPEDNGKYLACTANNPHFQDYIIEDGKILNILFAPILSLVMGASVKYQEIMEGSDVYFECNIQANPPVTEVAWRFNGHPLHSNPSRGVTVKNNSLLIRNVNKYHRGHYQCIATNAEGFGESEDVPLRVQYAPACAPGQKAYFGVAPFEKARVTCEVDADPANVVFRWSFNHSADSMNVVSFSSEGRKSVATYTPKSQHDYGILYCWAKNNVGIQVEPCVFAVIPAGPPQPLVNCTVTNQTESSFTVECEPGHDGGLDQTFHLQTYTPDLKTLIRNHTSVGQPLFRVGSLPAKSFFELVLFSSNAKGRSPPVTLKTHTLASAQRHTDDGGTLVVNPILAVLLGVVGALVLLAIVIIVIMRLQSSRDLEGSGIECPEHCEERTLEKARSLLETRLEDGSISEEKCPRVISSWSKSRGSDIQLAIFTTKDTETRYNIA